MSCDQSRGSQLRMCRSSTHGVLFGGSSGNATVTNGTRTRGSDRVSPRIPPPHVGSFDPKLRSPSRASPLQVSPGRSRRSVMTPSLTTAVPTPARLMVCPHPPSVNGNLGLGHEPRKRPGPGRMVTQREGLDPTPSTFAFRPPNFARQMSQRVPVGNGHSPDRASRYGRDGRFRRGMNQHGASAVWTSSTSDRFGHNDQPDTAAVDERHHQPATGGELSDPSLRNSAPFGGDTVRWCGAPASQSVHVVPAGGDTPVTR